ncbi:hypothetical protein HYX19_03635 [Candidatus Woesearchaeota archaeon]|nr:hypothetical protein [Candidatus Woesearchaeota archaeon]
MRQESFLKQFFDNVRTRFALVFIPELLLSVSFFSFLFYAKNKLYSYLALMQSYTPQITDLKSALENNSIDYSQLDSLINNIDLLNTKSLFLIYFLVPLVLFIIFIVFEGISFKAPGIKNFKELFDLKYFFKFLVLTLPLFFIMYLALRKFLEILRLFVLVSFGVQVPNFLQQIFLFLASLFIVSYLFILAYYLVDRNSIIETFKKTFVIGIKKAYLLVPAYFPMFLLFFVFLFLTSNLYLNYMFYGPEGFKISSVVGLLSVIVVVALYKIFFFLLIKRFEN